ncbi:MAG: orotidine-5'-phosphate decarboxylase [Crocinitomicaceae bacterium]|nr:orotidine-5'-phosphate decarboxylase [Crocinitomicaceae bacterium]
MNKEDIIEQIRKKKSFLCIGLDSDLSKIPSFLLTYDDPIYEFNKRIIDATQDLCVAYKPNIAFYETMGSKGWDILKKTLNYIPKNILTIADAKRADIGNTAKKYAETFFSTYNFDALTVSPYMGEDSIRPFLKYSNKWSIILGLTSNIGSKSFQNLVLKNGTQLYHEVIERSSKWGNTDNTMFVIGATKAQELKYIRKIIPDHFLLIPGIGAQGGDLDEVIKNGINRDVGLLINYSRGIIYAGNDKKFALKAREEAVKIQRKMAKYL